MAARSITMPNWTPTGFGARLAHTRDARTTTAGAMSRAWLDLWNLDLNSGDPGGGEERPPRAHQRQYQRFRRISAAGRQSVRASGPADTGAQGELNPTDGWRERRWRRRERASPYEKEDVPIPTPTRVGPVADALNLRFSKVQPSRLWLATVAPNSSSTSLPPTRRNARPRHHTLRPKQADIRVAQVNATTIFYFAISKYSRRPEAHTVSCLCVVTLGDRGVHLSARDRPAALYWLRMTWEN